MCVVALSFCRLCTLFCSVINSLLGTQALKITAIPDNRIMYFFMASRIIVLVCRTVSETKITLHNTFFYLLFGVIHLSQVKKEISEVILRIYLPRVTCHICIFVANTNKFCE